MGYFTTVENQVMFIVPTNNETRTLDYNIRLIITDNYLYPKVYEVTKVMDLFPQGCQKVVLKQVHYNKHTDLCGYENSPIENRFFCDNKIHLVADFYKSKINPDNYNHEHEYCDPITSESEESDVIIHEPEIWKLSEANEFLYINGQQQVIKAKSNVENSICDWHIFIDNEDYTDKIDELSSYFDITIDKENNSFAIKAINRVMANYIVKIAVSSKDNDRYDDFVEMEVCI